MRKPSDYTYHLMSRVLLMAGLLNVSPLMLQLVAQAQPSQSSPGWTATGSLNGARAGHTATRLPDGKVLVAGGAGGLCSGNFCYSTTINSAEFYDPATGTWNNTQAFGPRARHTSTLLPNGQVLVAGGARVGVDIGSFTVLNSTQLYDPATGRWRSSASLITGRHDHTATLLYDGRVLIVGGHSFNDEVRSAELYDPVTETWSSTSAPSTILRNHVAILLNDGKVLAASGKAAELYDPAIGQWRATNPPRALGSPYTATLLADGQVLATGTQSPFSTSTTAELYNPVTGEWTITAPLSGPGSWHTAGLLANGQVLVTGGVDANEQSISSAEIYDPTTRRWSLTSALNPPRGLHSATVLTNGKVLVVGGFSEGYYSEVPVMGKSAALFDFDLPQSGIVKSVSAASFNALGLASEAIASGFGTNLATATSGVVPLPLPTQLAGTTIKVKDSAGIERLSPLFYISPQQVNYQIPPGTAIGAATVTITSSDGKVSTGMVLVHAVAPSLFAANANGQGVAAAVAQRVKADGSHSYEALAEFDAAQNKFVARPLDLGPATDQVYLVLFGTGIRSRSALTAVIATIGSAYGKVSYAGAQPEFVGVDQVNVLLPRNLIGRGEVDVLLTVEAQLANPVRINIK